MTSTESPASSRQREVLRGIATHDDSVIRDLLAMQVHNIERSGLSPRDHAIARIAALIALDAAPASFAWQIGIAKESGVSHDDVIGIMIALAPTVGMAKIVATAPEIAFALDMPVDEDEGDRP
jgi:alkylhydroperoxidase/carboxymuconolactone decarboxylase family protein YurZ